MPSARSSGFGFVGFVDSIGFVFWSRRHFWSPLVHTLVALSLCFCVPPFWSRAVVAIMVAMRASHQKSGENEGKSLSFSYGRIRNISTGKHVIHKSHLVSHTIAKMATEYAVGNRNRFCF